VEAKDDFQRFLHGELVDLVRWITCANVPPDTKFSNATVHGFDLAHPSFESRFQDSGCTQTLCFFSAGANGRGSESFFELFELTRDGGPGDLLTTEF
jgi:hypothetical protein